MTNPFRGLSERLFHSSQSLGGGARRGEVGLLKAMMVCCAERIGWRPIHVYSGRYRDSFRNLMCPAAHAGDWAGHHKKAGLCWQIRWRKTAASVQKLIYKLWNAWCPNYFTDIVRILCLSRSRLESPNLPAETLLTVCVKSRRWRRSFSDSSELKIFELLIKIDQGYFFHIPDANGHFSTFPPFRICSTSTPRVVMAHQGKATIPMLELHTIDVNCIKWCGILPRRRRPVGRDILPITLRNLRHYKVRSPS